VRVDGPSCGRTDTRAIVSVSSGPLSEPATQGYGLAGDDGHRTVVGTSQMAVSRYRPIRNFKAIRFTGACHRQAAACEIASRKPSRSAVRSPSRLHGSSNLDAQRAGLLSHAAAPQVNKLNVTQVRAEGISCR